MATSRHPSERRRVLRQAGRGADQGACARSSTPSATRPSAKSHYMRARSAAASSSRTKCHHVKIDICAECGGIWLDTGEMELLRRREQSGGRESLQGILDLFPASGVAEVSARSPRPGDPQITPALVAEHGLTDRRVRAARRDARPRRRRSPSSGSSARCGASTARTSTRGPLLQDAADEGAVRAAGPGRERRASSRSATDSPSRSRSSRTTIRRRSSRTRARRPASAAFCATCSRWARARSRCSIRCASARSTRARVRYLFAGVVKGIGDYGNCVGIPTVARRGRLRRRVRGQSARQRDVRRRHAARDELIRAMAQGVGNPIIAVGARTGRDGIHGASFASEDLSEASDAKRPRVQVGDPFTEKLLLEAIARADPQRPHRRDPGHGRGRPHVVLGGDGGARRRRRHDRRDQGARARGGHDAVRDPAQRVAGAHARRGQARATRTRCAPSSTKWDLTAAVIGEVIAEPVYRVTEGDRVVAEFPGIAPRHRLPDVHARGARERRRSVALRERDVHAIRRASPRRAIRAGRSSSCSRRRRSPARRGSYRQYDYDGSHEHGRRPRRRRGGAAHARHRPRRSRSRPTATAATCTSIRAIGGRIAVAEAARNVACTGARPLAITNCLNFGNPKRPEVYLPAARSGRRNGRGVPGARHAGHRRQRLALQREPDGRGVSHSRRSGMVGLIDDRSTT